MRFDLAGIEVRPLLGRGAALLKQVVRVRPLDGTGVGTETTDTVWIITPGVIVTLPAGPMRLGGELRYIGGGDPAAGFSTDFESQSFVFYFRLSYVLGR